MSTSANTQPGSAGPTNEEPVAEGVHAEAEAAAMEAAAVADGGMVPGKAANFGPSFIRMIGILKPYAVPMVIVTLIGAVGVVLSVAAPKVLSGGINVIAETAGTPSGVDFTALRSVMLSLLLIYAGSAVLTWAEGFIINVIMVRAVWLLRERVEAKINRLPLAYFDRMPRGQVISRVTNDIDNITQTMQQSLSGAITALLTVIGVIIMMFTISWVLALVALASIPLMGVVFGVIGPRSQAAFKQQWAKVGALNTRVEESFSGHALVKVFGRERSAAEQFDLENEELFKASFKAQFLSNIMMPAMTFIGSLVYVGIAVIGASMVAGGSLKIGDVVAFLQYSQQFTQPLAQLGGMAAVVQSGTASAERVFELLDADEQEPDATDAPALVEGAGVIEFEHVQFAYAPEKPLITDLSFRVEPGQTVAIVGPTGAGKTTLVNLIMRFYELDGGRILLDGQDIADLTRDDLRRRAGMVLQDPWLFAGSIRENIRYGRADATDEEIVAAAVATRVDNFVRSLPEGYDTVLDEDAANVSAGERQLITIARAFVSQPSVLILDEATSSVDTRTEVLLQHAMAALRAGRTSFVIAHRLSTIRDADLILVMEHGDIVEQGTHDELIAAHGAYYRLYQSQFEQALDVDERDEVAVGEAGTPTGTITTVTGATPVPSGVLAGAAGADVSAQQAADDVATGAADRIEQPVIAEQDDTAPRDR